MKLLTYSAIAGSLLCTVACGSSKSDKPSTEKASASEKPAPTKVQDTKEAAPAPKTQELAKVGEEDRTAPEHMEPILNATSTVQPHDFKGQLPDDFDKDQLRGDLHGVIGWTDKYGLQAIVFSLSVSEKEGEDGEDPATSAMLQADFVLREGDAWTSQRQFKAALDDCMFDAEIGAVSGPWSVTDLDMNGVAEVSFAWSVGCRSDVSPIKHKVFLVGRDENAVVQKYVLRGTTGIEMGGAVDDGGTFQADDSFKTQPKSFLEHATKVWKKTSIERID